MANCSPSVSAASQGRKGARLGGGISSSLAVVSSSALVLVDKRLRSVCPGGKKPYFAISGWGSCTPAKSVSKTTTAASFNALSTAGVRHFTSAGSRWKEPNRKTLPLGPATFHSAGASTWAAASRAATGENARLSAARLNPIAAARPRSTRGNFMSLPRRAAPVGMRRDGPAPVPVPSLHQLDVLERQAPYRFAGRGKNGVEHGGRHHADRRFAHAAPEVVRRNDHRLDLGHFGEPQEPVVVEVQLHHAPFLDGHLTVQRRAQSIHHRAFDLGGDLVGVDRMAAVEREHHAVHLDLAVGAHG